MQPYARKPKMYASDKVDPPRAIMRGSSIANARKVPMLNLSRDRASDSLVLTEAITTESGSFTRVRWLIESTEDSKIVYFAGAASA